MENMIYLPPHPGNMVESIRSVGYTFETALADILDNSVAAKATRIDILRFPGEDRLCIVDNGVGMNGDTLTQAMQLGSADIGASRSAEDLGRFGLGLKIASWSQCRKLTVISKHLGKIEGRCWDLDVVKRQNKWVLTRLLEKEIQESIGMDILQTYDSGTIVIWEKFDRIEGKNKETAFNSLLSKARSYLELVFHRFMEEGNVDNRLRIALNYSELEPYNPFKGLNPIQESEKRKVGDHQIIITPFVLRHFTALTDNQVFDEAGEYRLKKEQGFFIYRNKRLIQWGDWFNVIRGGESTKLIRIQVDFPNTFDMEWQLNVEKTTVKPPEAVLTILKPFAKHMLQNAQKRIKQGAKRESGSGVVQMIWERKLLENERIYYAINQEHILIRKLFEIFDDNPRVRRHIESVLEIIANQLPLEQIRYDLDIGGRIQRKNDIPIESLINKIRSVMPNANRKMFEMILQSEPFNEYVDVLEEYWNKGVFSSE